MKFPTNLLVLAAVLSATSAAWACGDKLSAIGGGIRFERMYAARHPGRIAMLIPDDSRFAAASRDLKLVEALKRAGHTVVTYSSVGELQQEMQSRDTQAVLMDVADSGADAGRMGSATIVWVAPDATPTTMTVAASSRCVVHIGRRSTPLLLRAVDDALERRERGLVPDCGPQQGNSGI